MTKKQSHTLQTTQAMVQSNAGMIALLRDIVSETRLVDKILGFARATCNMTAYAEAKNPELWMFTEMVDRVLFRARSHLEEFCSSQLEDIVYRLEEQGAKVETKP